MVRTFGPERAKRLAPSLPGRRFVDALMAEGGTSAGLPGVRAPPRVGGDVGAPAAPSTLAATRAPGAVGTGLAPESR